ncbi:MAG: SCO family protein [Ignavibacteriae bacterium]|nr:SCO family protein [Ignavibacteriota bacterium]
MISKKRITLLAIFGLPLLTALTFTGYLFYSTLKKEKSTLLEIGVVPEFSFITQDGLSFSRNDLLGKITIVDFIFTSCAGICPMMSTKMAKLQQEVLGFPLIQFLSISVDPETDTPEVLSTYARGYGAIKGKWTFLTGNKNEIYTLTREGFHLGLDIEGEDAIIHSQKFVLVDDQGMIRGYFDSEIDNDIKKLVREARILVKEISS